MDGWHIDAIAEHLEAVTRGQIRQLLINVPPRHGKSNIVSVLWPAWEWTSTPERKWLFASYSQKLSTRDSVACRRLIESAWYQANWPEVKIATDQNEKMRYENTRRGVRIASSVGGTVTGEGGDRIVVDDPHATDEVESDAVRQSVLNWWDGTMVTRLNDPRTGTKVIIGQRVHQQDLSGHVLEQGGWEHLCLPAEFEGDSRKTSIGWTDPRTEPGDLLWPERFGREELDTLKTSMGSYAAASQLQQRPSPAGGGILKRHWWRYWQPRGAGLPPVMVKHPDGSLQPIAAVQLPEKLERVIQSWDMAFKDLKTSDFVVGQTWGCSQANRFLLDQVRPRDIAGCARHVGQVAAVSRKDRRGQGERLSGHSIAEARDIGPDSRESRGRQDRARLRRCAAD
jgi:hypothetical protein